jgi:hypothetical protein
LTNNALPILAPSCPKSNPEKINPASETPAIKRDLSVVPMILTANNTVFLRESVLARPDTTDVSYPVMLVANVEYRSNVTASARLLSIECMYMSRKGTYAHEKVMIIKGSTKASPSISCFCQSLHLTSFDLNLG